MVSGHKVSFMYREKPNNQADSGWCFLSGLETDEYMDNPSNHGIYDVNTVANYDPAIVPFLNAPIGSELERVSGTDKFRIVSD